MRIPPFSVEENREEHRSHARASAAHSTREQTQYMLMLISMTQIYSTPSPMSFCMGLGQK